MGPPPSARNDVSCRGSCQRGRAMSHVIGVLIAIVTLLLLLSMVVTGLVQATQGLLRIRSKNLLVAVAAVLQKHYGAEFATKRERLKAAARILNADNIALVDQVSKPDSVLRRRWLGPRVSWAAAQDLADATLSQMERVQPSASGAASQTGKVPVVDAGGRPQRTKASMEHDFNQLEPALKKRFQRFMCTWTILWSFVVAIAFQVRDVADLMVREAHIDLPELAVDGGAAASNLLCQLQADQLGVPVVRPQIIETTGLGAAFLAGLGAGVWSTPDELRAARQIDRRFEPGRRNPAAHLQWRAAVERAKGWADGTPLG